MVDAFVYLGSMIDSSGGSRGEVLHRIGIARSFMNLLEKRIWKSSIRLAKIRLYQTFVVPVLLYGCETWSTTKQSSSALALMYLTCGHYARFWGYHTPAMWRMWKSEQPSDAILSPTWSLTDVCGSLDILPTELDQLLLKCISITKYKLHFFKVIQILFSITLATTGKIQNTFLESN